jgi:transposase
MKPYSLDLREKIIHAYEAGIGSIRRLAEIFQVNKSTVQNFLNQKRETGSLAPAPAKGGKQSQLLGHEQKLEEMVKESPALTLSEYCEVWEEKTGVRVSVSTMYRFLKKQNLTLKKKTFRSSQAAKEEVQIKRLAYWDAIRDVAPENLIFLDEMGVLLGMLREYGRSLKGERLYDFKPFYRGSRITVIGAITQNSIIAMKTLGSSMTGNDFRVFVQEDLAPKLWPGAIVVMDNLAAHKVKGITELIEAKGARVVYNASYSPEFNPIEHLWWELKSFIRKFSPTCIGAVNQLIQLGCLLCSSIQLRNYFTHCCYCTK